MTERPIWHPEPEPVLMNRWIITCIDERIRIDNAYRLGIPGSGIVTEYDPDVPASHVVTTHDKRCVYKARKILFPALARMVEGFGGRLAGTSHTNCGWAGAQGIDDRRIPGETSKTFALLNRRTQPNLQVPYLGHIEMTDGLRIVGDDKDLKGQLRLTPDHKHNAGGILYTTGGGISKKEQDKLEGIYGPMFVVSADAGYHATHQPGILPANESTMRDYYRVVTDVANKIMGKFDGVDDMYSFYFNAGRITPKQADHNIGLLQHLRRIPHAVSIS